MFKPDPKPEKKEKIKKGWNKVKTPKPALKLEVVPVAKYREMKLFGWRKKSKYHNVQQEYNGVKYDSKFEAKIAQDLDWRMEAGELVEIKRQVKIPLKVNGLLICNYYCDFRVVDCNGGVTYIEAKGMVTDVFQVKKKLFLALLNEIDPGAEYTIVTQ